MRSSAIKPQAIGFVILGVLIVFAALKAWRAGSTRSASPAFAHHYSVKLLAQFAAEPGKIIRITNQGLLPIEYTCQPDDAAVGVVQVADSAPGSNSATDSIALNCGPAVDSERNHYEVTALQGQGNIYFVKIRRGFAVAPEAIRVTLSAGPAEDFPTPLSVTISQIASPKRVLSPPSRAASAAADRIAIAETVARHTGVFVRLSQKQSPSETYDASVLATSFCPGPPEGWASYHPDAAEVLIVYKKRETHDFVLAYRNAKVVQISGNRMLVLPTDQVVGVFAGRQIILRKVDQALYNIHSLSHSLALINLVEGTTSAQPPGASFRCLSISPSPESMGLSYVQVVMNTLGSSQIIEAGRPAPANLITHIPELKLRCRAEQWDNVGSRKLTLAVRHVADDPALGLSRVVPTGLGVAVPRFGSMGFGPMPMPPRINLVPPPMRRRPHGAATPVPMQSAGK